MTAFGGYAWQVLIGCIILITIIFIWIISLNRDVLGEYKGK